MIAMEDSRDRLARAVEDAIADAGLQYTDVASRAGFSVETLSKIRTGRRVRTPTLRKLELALEWPKGRTEALLTALAEANPLPAPGEAAGWDGELGEGPATREGEVLRWLSTERGIAYRLEYPAEGVSIDYTFPADEPVEQVLESLRGLLDSHRERVREMQEGRAHR